MTTPTPLRTPERRGALPPEYRHARLAVLFHGYRHTPWNLEDLQRLIHEELPETDFFMPELPFTRASASDLADESIRIALEIARHWTERAQRHGGEPYREILLIGHSAGATLARSVFLAGCGYGIPAAHREPCPAAAWAEKVTRIVQLAAFNRGWRVSYLAQGFRAVPYALARWFFMLVRPVWGEHFLFQVYRGAPFVNELRLRWQELQRRHRREQKPWPAMIQMLGSKDDLVPPDETVDLATSEGFVFLDVAYSDHFNIAKLDAERSGKREEPRALAERRRQIAKALRGDLEALRAESELESAFTPDDSIDDVIFVVHGIRDGGFWTQHVGRAVLDEAREAGRKDKVKVLTPSYGYFGMGPFLLPWNRRAKAAWFIEHYLEARARYPEARISYIGHSNGTYLPVSALKHYPSVRFHHLAFAGSVVRKSFPWEDYLGPEPAARVGRVCNFVATSDWVVAFFPRMFEIVPLTDLGSAGHAGFWPERLGQVENVRYAPGGHGVVPSEEDFWPHLARFILHGIIPPQAAPLLPERGRGVGTRLVAWNGKCPILVWLLCIALVAGLFWLMIALGGLIAHLSSTPRQFWTGAMTVLTIVLLRFILHRV